MLQGDEDWVVPPPGQQACVMHDALRPRGLVTALVMFAGERHGLRQAGSIRRSLDGERHLFGRVLGGPLGDGPARRVARLTGSRRASGQREGTSGARLRTWLVALKMVGFLVRQS
jgi:hypothetical protein